jgi:Tol biopolymer transport system component
MRAPIGSERNQRPVSGFQGVTELALGVAPWARIGPKLHSMTRKRGTALRLLLASVGSLALALAVTTMALAANARTALVSVNSSGEPANAASGNPSLSADGRFVAFVSYATNLDPSGDRGVFVRDRKAGTTRLAAPASGPNRPIQPSISADGRFVAYAEPDAYGDGNIHLHDMRSGKTSLVTVGVDGNPAGGRSQNPSLSANGRFVAFSSGATNLTQRKPIAGRNEFVRDMKTGKTQQVNVSSSGRTGNGYCHHPSISADGRYVAYESNATNLVKGAHGYNVYVRDLKQHRTILASVSSSGKRANRGSHKVSISGDGRYVAFASKASNLVKQDTNKSVDIFRRDLVKHKTVRVSVNSSGKQSNGNSGFPVISNHGGFIAFVSSARNLVSRGDGKLHVFFRDERRGKTVQADVSFSGHSANTGVGALIPFYTSSLAMSADGRRVAIESPATNLVPGHAGGTDAVYVRGPMHG